VNHHPTWLVNRNLCQSFGFRPDYMEKADLSWAQPDGGEMFKKIRKVLEIFREERIKSAKKSKRA
jgi:hypothetical protein